MKVGFRYPLAMSVADLISRHLNAPYGNVVSPDDVIRAIVDGRVDAASEAAQGPISYLFHEVEHRLIATVALRHGGSHRSANELYLDTLRLGVARHPDWESSLEHLL